MELINGLTLLYSEYSKNILTKCLVVGIIIVMIGVFVGILTCMIKERDFSGWWILMLVLAFCAGFTGILINQAESITKYHVQVDETTSYIEMVETYGADNIYHEGGDVYTIVEYGDKE